MNKQRNWIFDELKLDDIKPKFNGKGIKIAVIDTGIDTSIPSLKHVKTENQIDLTTSQSLQILEDTFSIKESHKQIQFVQGINAWSTIDNQIAQDVHGSQMAAIIGARSSQPDLLNGIASQCELIIIKVGTLDEQRSQKIEEKRNQIMSLAIYLAIAKQAQLVNISQEVCKCSADLHTAVMEAHKRDTILVCAAGNSPEDGEIEYPAAFQKTFSIGSYNKFGDPSGITDKGTLLDFATPGKDVISFIDAGNNSLESGTSISAAIATAIMALTIQSISNTRVKYHQLKKHLIEHAKNDPKDPHNPEWGYGIICPKKLGLTN